MASIEPNPPHLLPAEPLRDSPAFWAGVVARALRWGDAERVDWRDAIVLVPFAQLLPLARQAWAREGGWLPRIETTQTLTASLAPAPAVRPGQISFDMPTDRLVAAHMLRERPWARALVQRDPRHFEHAVGAVVELAHALLRRAAAEPPGRRDAYWLECGLRMAPADGPGQSDIALARAALDWAAASAPPASDVLHALRPSAWIAIQAGGPDPLTQSILSHARVPRLVIDTDVPRDAPFDGAAPACVDFALADDFEDEAQQSAARVLAYLRSGVEPVALIAQDRSLVRRVRALLERSRVGLLDETGWRLSTTRAAGRLMALLRSMRSHPSSDEVLDWLKASAADGPALGQRRTGTSGLESAMRRRGWSRWAAVDPSLVERPAQRLHADVQALRERFAAPRSRPLVDWLRTLRQALEDCGDAKALADDAAGQEVLRTLHLDDPAAAPAAWLDATQRFHMTLDEFIAWADDALEEANFRPEAASGPQVVITPLGRAMLRPFAAVVCPGADDRRLGRGGRPWPLVGDTLARGLGLDDAAARRDRELLAFAQLLRAPRLSLLRRRRDGSEPLAASPLLERLKLGLARAGQGVGTADDARTAFTIEARPTPRPTPSGAALVPGQLSASAVSKLRACPYSFFALSLLRLQESDELGDEVEKRDYGTWLHAVLHRFHTQRERCADLLWDDRQQLDEAARVERERMALDEADFLPFAASFEQFAPRYLAWLGEREAAGAHWSEGEREIRARPQELGEVELFGRIDRIDRVRQGGTVALELIDYKTGSVSSLKDLLADATEDTQLAFYAALMMRQDHPPSRPLEASYLALDNRDRIERLPHRDVEVTAAALVRGLGDELARVRAGEPLPALGAGKACAFCPARGLCRRDDWTEDR